LVEKQLKNVLLIIAFALAFVYRLILLTWQTFPSGSDIGLHESVIKTIMSGKTNFFVNYYHMGGGTSATNPGYHIFVAALITLTSLPDLSAQVIVAALFSAITILCVFLVVRKAWNARAGYIAAFLAAFSGGDLAMLSWGGYPNIIALMLIPTVFFLFMQKDRFSRLAFFGTTSLMISSMFLTHVFSSIIFVIITMATLVFCLFFYKRTGFTRNLAVSWIISLVLGILLISPYLYNVIPAYFGSESTVTGTSASASQALLETRAVATSILIISTVFGLAFFALSKIYKHKTITVPAVLFCTWLIAPAIMTQASLLGVYVDYQRFLYFLYLPLIASITLLALLIVKASKLASRLSFKISKAGLAKQPKMVRNAFFILFSVCLVLALFSTPLLSTPLEGFEETEYYRAMTPPKYDAINWIKSKTPENSVFVADSALGWWISGFAQRPTLSAANPQFLILAHEIEAAEAARNLLTTDYLIDNGLLQINYLDNNTNNVALAGRIGNSFVLHPFFYFKNENMSILYRVNNQPHYMRLNELTTSNIEVKNGSNWASFTITYENKQFTVSEVITIQQGLKFAKINLNIQSKNGQASFDWLNIPFVANGAPTSYPKLVNFEDQSMQSNISLIFPENQLEGTVTFSGDNSDFYELNVNNGGVSSVNFEFSLGFQETASITQNTVNQEITSFDYKKTINAWNMSYVVVTDKAMLTRFLNHQTFSLVFKNEEVGIFKIEQIKIR
jgi:hypothetical protein